MKRALFVLMVVSHSAHADSVVALKIGEKELAAALAAMRTQLEEPVGLVALARNPRLGLERGDVVRRTNGFMPEEWRDGISGYPIVGLDVVRRGKPVAI